MCPLGIIIWRSATVAIKSSRPPCIWCRARKFRDCRRSYMYRICRGGLRQHFMPPGSPLSLLATGHYMPTSSQCLLRIAIHPQHHSSKHWKMATFQVACTTRDNHYPLDDRIDNELHDRQLKITETDYVFPVKIYYYPPIESGVFHILHCPQTDSSRINSRV